MAAVRHLELMYGSARPPTISNWCPETFVQISSRSVW